MGDIRPLNLPGWAAFSTWGYKDVWITPGAWPVVESADALAELIAQASVEPLDTVRSAMQLT